MPRLSTPISPLFLLSVLALCFAVSYFPVHAASALTTMASSGECAVPPEVAVAVANEITKKLQGLPGETVLLDVNGYPVALLGLQLEQVHVYV